MTNVLPDNGIEHLDFRTSEQATEAPKPRYRRPRTHEEHLQWELIGYGVDATGMHYQALRAFATAKAISDTLVSNEPPAAVNELLANLNGFNTMVLVGLRHFSQSNEFASGAE